MTATEQRIGKLAASDLESLRGFRARAGWMLRPDETGSYWLRVPAGDEEDFRKLPLLGRWVGLPDGKMVREGRQVPEAILPGDGWRALAEFFPLAPPPRGAPGMPPVPVSFQLEKDDADLPAGALLCDWESLAAWADTCFAPRLEKLRFACSNDDRAFVCGEPLPPLRGSSFHAIGRLWLPCGYRLPDHVWTDLLEELLGLGKNRIAILHPDGSHEEMDEENLITATRAAVRASMSREPV